MTAVFGPPPLNPNYNWVLDRACEDGNPYSLTKDIRNTLLIYRFMDRVNQLMSSNVIEPTGLPYDKERFVILKLLEEDVQHVRLRLGTDTSGKRLSQN
jgi:hypothetical protein